MKKFTILRTGLVQIIFFVAMLIVSISASSISDGLSSYGNKSKNRTGAS